MPQKLINAGDPLNENFSKGPAVGEPVPDFTLPKGSNSLPSVRTQRESCSASRKNSASPTPFSPTSTVG